MNWFFENITKIIPDKPYLRLQYLYRTHRILHLKNPQTFNEKIQWLKLYDRKPVYTEMADKYAAKKYVADIIGSQYVIPALGVWERFEDIDFDTLPKQFVLKCTHDSGGLVIVRDKERFDKKAAGKKIERCLKSNYYYHGREWPYKDIRPRIIAEKYMEETENEIHEYDTDIFKGGGIRQLKDYKIFNFDGEPKLIQVDYDRFIQHKRNFYSTDWKYIRAAVQYPSDAGRKIPKPEKLDEMLVLARKLSKGHSFLRTDFYYTKDRIYFGELTFYPECGFGLFRPEEFGFRLGARLRLPQTAGCIR